MQNKTNSNPLREIDLDDEQYFRAQQLSAPGTRGFWVLNKQRVPNMTSPMNHSQFLPEFLLRDETQLLSGSTEEGVCSSRLVSPGTADTSAMSPNTSLLHHISPHSRLTPSRPDYNKGSRARLNGPPIASLFDEKSDKVMQNGNVTQSSPTNQMETSPIADNMQDTEGHWVVVFGFPPSHSAHILSIFSQKQLGLNSLSTRQLLTQSTVSTNSFSSLTVPLRTSSMLPIPRLPHKSNVLEHSIPPCGNWMFVKYSCRIEVRKALTYDKRIVNGNIMIGVAERKNMSQMRPIIGTPNSAYNSIVSSPSIASSPLMSPRVRHLSANRRDIQGTNEPPVPQKDTSVVARAMDLLFGW